MIIPETAAPITQPRTPPVAFPMIAAHPISKKHVETSGITTVGNMPAVSRIVIMEVTIATKKPITRAFGAYGKITGTSSAGIAFGTNLSAIPLKAGTISAINIRTPWSMIVIPTPK